MWAYKQKKIGTIKLAVQPVSGSLYPRTFMDMIEAKPSIKMARLGSIFQYWDNISMMLQALEEYLLAST